MFLLFHHNFLCIVRSHYTVNLISVSLFYSIYLHLDIGSNLIYSSAKVLLFQCFRIKCRCLMQINLGIYVKDNKKEFSILVDRAMGGSSLVDGQIELMLHRFITTLIILSACISFIRHHDHDLQCSFSYRRLLRDDGKGVAEALNETVCIDNQCKGLTVSSFNQMNICGHSIPLQFHFFIRTFIFRIQNII